MSKSTALPFTSILLASFLNMNMQTLVAAILPQIVQDIGGQSLYSWVFSSFLLLSTITIPLFAKLADQSGAYQRWFYMGMGLFISGTWICGMANTMPTFLLGRSLQGLGMGAIGPVSLALLSRLFPIEKRGGPMGLYAATQLLANISAPLIGAWISQTWHWSIAFYIVIPIGILASCLMLTLSNRKQSKISANAAPFDWIGALLLGGAIALFIQGCTIWGQSPFYYSFLFFAGSLGCGIWLLFQEQKHTDPILPAKLMKIPNVRLANASAFLIGMLMYGLTVILPLYSLENQIAHADKILIPLLVGTGIGVILSGQLMKRLSYQKLASIGWAMTFVSTIGLLLGGFYPMHELAIFSLIFFIGFGIGSLMPTFLLPAQAAVSDQQQAVVGGFVQLSRNTGGAIGIPILTTLLTVPIGFTYQANSYNLVFALLAICAGIGYIIGTRFTNTVHP